MLATSHSLDCCNSCQVNSFGYGGANAHVVVDAAASLLPEYRCTRAKLREEITPAVNGPPNIANKSYKTPIVGSSLEKQAFRVDGDQQLDRKTVNTRDQFLLVLSAHNESTLNGIVGVTREAVDNYRLIDLAHTLAVRRSTFSEKRFSVASESNVRSIFASESRTSSRTQRPKMLDIAFVFTGKSLSSPRRLPPAEVVCVGQGAQWMGMGADLMRSFPSYLKTIRHLDGVLRGLDSPPAWTLEGDENDTAPVTSQPFAVLTLCVPQAFSETPARLSSITQSFHSQLRRHFKSLLSIFCSHGI